jgi:hypothetical protein
MASEKLRLKALSTVVYWPLTLDLDPASRQDDLADRMDRQIRRLMKTGLWEHVADGLEHLGWPDYAKHELPDPAAQRRANDAARDDTHKVRAHAYAEYTYFHDFVQSFLFDPQPRRYVWRDGSVVIEHRDGGRAKGPPPGPLLLFRRKSPPAKVEIELDGVEGAGGPEIHTAEIHRVNLYILRSGIAVLALDLRFGAGAIFCAGTGEVAPASLAHAMAFNDRVRRSHAPYLIPDSSGYRIPSGQVPRRVKWLDGGAGAGVEFAPRNDIAGLPERLRALGHGAREVAPFRHWIWLINGDMEQSGGHTGWDIAPGRAKGDTWRHVSDERLPILSAITLETREDYQAVGDGDWYRLAFVDGPGGDPYPYQSRFLAETAKRAFYDRYHYTKAGQIDQDGPRDSSDPPIRYLISPYSFIAVGCGDPYSAYSTFFEFPVAPVHVPRHYFQLMLLAQFEKTTLLAISTRVTQAVARYDEENQNREADAEAGLRDRLIGIQADLTQYVHRFRFSGVSTQLQPTELFKLIRAQSELDTLYEDVKTELTEANAYLDLRAQRQTAEAQERLSIIATVGLAFSFLGMNVLIGDDFLDKAGLVRKDGPAAAHIGLVLLTVGVVSGLAWMLGVWLRGPRADRRAKRFGALLRGLGRMAQLGILVGLGLLAASRWMIAG